MSADEVRKEGREIEEYAVELLRNPQRAIPPGRPGSCDPDFVLWRFPSFAAYRSWSLFPPGHRKDQEAFLLELSWDQVGDMDKGLDPQKGLSRGLDLGPTMSRRYALVEWAQVEPFLAEAREIRVPLVGSSQETRCDGESLGFKLGLSPFAGILLTWWGDGPDEWRFARDWAHRVRSLLEGILEKDGSPVSPWLSAWALQVELQAPGQLPQALKAVREVRELSMKEVASLKSEMVANRPALIGTHVQVKRWAARLREHGIISYIFCRENSQQGSP